MAMRAVGYFALVAGSLLTAIIFHSLEGKDHGGIGAGIIIIPCMGIAVMGYVGILLGCVIEKRPKEFALWLLARLLVGYFSLA